MTIPISPHLRTLLPPQAIEAIEANQCPECHEPLDLHEYGYDPCTYRLPVFDDTDNHTTCSKCGRTQVVRLSNNPKNQFRNYGKAYWRCAECNVFKWWRM
jgi:hypothetical protein